MLFFLLSVYYKSKPKLKFQQATKCYQSAIVNSYHCSAHGRSVNNGATPSSLLISRVAVFSDVTLVWHRWFLDSGQDMLCQAW